MNLDAGREAVYSKGMMNNALTLVLLIGLPATGEGLPSAKPGSAFDYELMEMEQEAQRIEHEQMARIYELSARADAYPTAADPEAIAAGHEKVHRTIDEEREHLFEIRRRYRDILRKYSLRLGALTVRTQSPEDLSAMKSLRERRTGFIVYIERLAKDAEKAQSREREAYADAMQRMQLRREKKQLYGGLAGLLAIAAIAAAGIRHVYAPPGPMAKP